MSRRDLNMSDEFDDDEGVTIEAPEVTTKTKVSSSSVEGSLSLLVNGKGGSKVLFPGDIIIKAQLEDDIRCINYNNQELTFVDLLKLLERMFKKAIKATDDLVIKYKDGEGDYVTMEDTDDVGFAIRTCGGLNIKILRVNKPEEDKKLQCSDIIRAELTEIRNRANKLLDRLEGNDSAVCGLDSNTSIRDSLEPTAPCESKTSVARVSQVSTAAPAAQITPSVLPVAGNIEATEFDPLNGVASTDDRRSGITAPVVAQQLPPQSVSSTPVKQVIDSFQPTPRGDAHTPSVVSSITANHRTDQPNQPFSQQQSQHASSLFDVGHGMTTKAEGVVSYSPIPSQPMQSQYAVAASQVPGVQQPQPPQQPAPPQPQQQPHSNVPTNTMYPAAPTANMYASSNQYQYQTPTPSYGAPAPPSSSYSHMPNATPTSMNSSWNDNGANSQARGYPQMGISSTITPGGQQGNMSPMPSSTGQNMYATNLQSTPQMFGQMGGGVQPPPPGMSAAQAPPQMPASQGPPMGVQYRQGSSAPPPPTGAGAAASANPYSRTASNRERLSKMTSRRQHTTYPTGENSM